MGLDEIVAELKSRPGFVENVGMIVLHNGVVRGWSRDGHKKVVAVEVTANEELIGKICTELGARPGIFALTAIANEGRLKPGEDLLYLAVAGDVRENCLAVFEELLNRIKKEAVSKREIFAD